MDSILKHANTIYSGKCKLSAKDFGSARAYYEARAERKSDCSDAGDAKSKKLSPKEFQKQQKLRQREKAREASRKKDLERAARIAAIQAEKAAQQERKALFDELPEEMPEAPSYLQAVSLFMPLGLSLTIWQDLQPGTRCSECHNRYTNPLRCNFQEGGC